MEKHKKIVAEKLAKDKDKREETKQKKQVLVDFMKQESIQSVIAQYRKQLRHVFQYYSRLDNLEINSMLSQTINTLDLPKFSKFCLHFKIVPILLTPEEVVTIFRNSTISGQKEPGKGILGLDYDVLTIPYN